MDRFTSQELNPILDLLDKFVRGDDRSLSLAGEIEVALDRAFPEDEAIQDVVLALASYRPGGGAFLYDEAAMIPKCKWVREEIRRLLETT